MERSLHPGSSASGDLEIIGLADGTVSLVNACGRDGWQGPADLPVPNGYAAPSFASLCIGNYRDTLQVIGMGADGSLYVVCYLDGNGWQRGGEIGRFAGASITCLTAANSHDGDLEVIALKDGRPHLMNWLNDDGWHGSKPLPVPDGLPKLESLALGSCRGTLQVVGLGDAASGRALYIASYLPKGHDWTRGSKVGGFPGRAVTSIATGNTRSGDLQIVGLIDGQPHILAWLGSEGGWRDSRPLPRPEGYEGTFTQLALSSYRGTLEVMGIGSDNSVYIVCYIPFGSDWQKGAKAPSPLKGETVTGLKTGTTPSGELQVVGLADGTPYLLAWLDGSGWQSGMSLAFDPLHTAFAKLPTSGRQISKFNHSDMQATAHIQGMTKWNGYRIFSHNRTDAYGYLLFGDEDGRVQEVEVAVNGAGGNGSDAKYYHPSSLSDLTAISAWDMVVVWKRWGWSS